MMRAAVLVVTALLLLARPAPSEAQIYRWVDDKGVPNYSDGLDSVPQKHRATAVPLGLRNAPAAGSEAAGGQSGGAAAGRGTQIRFVPGKEIVVDARLNGITPVKLILDTGAQRTVIDPRVLAVAGVLLRTGEAAQIRGATGTARVSTVRLESVEVGEAKVGNLSVISHDIEHGGVDGLLGRDFLDQFKVAIDSKEGIVTLSPK